MILYFIVLKYATFEICRKINWCRAPKYLQKKMIGKTKGAEHPNIKNIETKYLDALHYMYFLRYAKKDSKSIN